MRNEQQFHPSAEKQTIYLQGIRNARELGGYPTRDGRFVKWKKILRTAELGQATESDIRRLKEVYHLSMVADLRMKTEIKKQADPLIPGVRNEVIHIIDEDEMQALYDKVLAEKKGEGVDLSDPFTQLRISVEEDFINDTMYIDFFRREEGKRGFRQMMREFIDLPEESSLLFHCTQGKDRTGCVAMMILSVLGVDEEIIYEDYLLTNIFNAQLIEKERAMLVKRGIQGEVQEKMMFLMDQVHRPRIEIVVKWLKENYGSVEGYVKQELGIGEAEMNGLREKYLTDKDM